MIVNALDDISKSSTAAALLDQAERCILLANQQIMELRRQRGGSIIGSTVAILLIFEDHYACLWAGDSRLYIVSHEKITQITRDHTEIEEMLASGAVTTEEAMHLPGNAITNAIGVREKPELEIATGAIDDSDIFVLCSDGLTRHVANDEIRQFVTGRDAQTGSDNLVQLALARGGLDNVTVIVVRTARQADDLEHSAQMATSELPAADVWE